MEEQRKLIEMKASAINKSKETISTPSSSTSDRSSSPNDIRNYSPRSYYRWAPVEEGVTLAWQDLSVDILSKNRGILKHKRIINSVTGAVKAGSLVALMGASGAGKSTLMSALAYRYSGGMLIEGDVLVNGRPVGNYMKYLSGFMHQHDLFVGALTVFEHMNIMAKLKLDRRLSSYDRKSKIYDILSQLGLIHKMDTRIGLKGDQKVLSGGEKKRLAFATELLTDPPLLFCDEPTTGLDSYSAQKLISMMNLMAAQGKTIVCTIHQPSSELFAMFSQILLVADGRIAFIGSTQNGIDFFKHLGYPCPSSYNPADFFIRTLAIAPNIEENSKQTVKRICDYYAVSDAAKEMNVVVQFEFHMGRSSHYSSYTYKNGIETTSWWNKLCWLVYRGFLECVRDPSIQGFRILQKLGIAIMVGFCYVGTNAFTQSGIQSIQGAIIILVTENTFMPMYSVLNLFSQELPLFIREYRSGLYSIWIYYVAKILAILPGVIFEPIIFTLIMYYMCGLSRNTYSILMTILSTLLTMNVSTACGCFFSTAFDSVPSAMAYLVPFDVVMMVTQGIFINLSTLPVLVSWAQYLSWMMYSTETMTIVQWDGVQNISCEIPDPKVPCLTEGWEVLNKYSFKSSHLWRNILAMLGLYFTFHIFSFICLWFKTKKK